MKSRQSILTLIVSVLTWFFAMQTGWSFYSPSAGKWLNRDPSAEAGGINLYSFTGNEPVSGLDALGLHLKRPEQPKPWHFFGTLQRPMDPNTKAVTAVTYTIFINDVDISSCYCRLSTASFEIDIETDLNYAANINTILHEGAHAAADDIYGTTMLPKVIRCLKSKCWAEKSTDPAECRKKLQAEADKATHEMKRVADGLLQQIHHLYIGEQGYSWMGEDKFEAWFNGWLPASQDDIARSGDCKFW